MSSDPDKTLFGRRMGDWAEYPPIVDRSPLRDPDEINLDGLDDEDRQIILNARERKAKRLAQERGQRGRAVDGPEPTGD